MSFISKTRYRLIWSTTRKKIGVKELCSGVVSNRAMYSLLKAGSCNWNTTSTMNISTAGIRCGKVLLIKVYFAVRALMEKK
jgi:hypothetical protein